MSKLLRRISLWTLSFLFVLCVSILGVHTSFSAKAEGAPTVVNLTFNALGLNGGENNDTTIVNGRYLTAVRFQQGVLSGSANGDTAAYDYSNLMETAVFTGDGDYGFVPGATKWAEGYKSEAVFNFFYFWTANAPVANDTLGLKAGSYFTMSGTMADGTLCNDKYVLSEDVNMKFNGTAWEIYLPVVEPEIVPVTFTHINSDWNDNTTILGNAIHYTVLHLNGLLTSGHLANGDDWTEMLANSTINGGASYFNFSSASYLAGPDVVSDFIILYSAETPKQGDEFIVKAGATFDVGGADTNLYQLTNDICLKYNGTAWEVFTPVVKPSTVAVNYQSINSTWNNYFYLDTYCSLIYFDGGVGGGSLDGDYTDLLAKMTIDGQPVDTNNVTFMCPLWVGADGGIIIRFTENPATGAVMKLPQGAMFTVGGEDTNVYEIAADVSLKFDGAIWTAMDAPTEPEIPDEPTPVDPVSVKFTGVNGAWNNFDYTDVGYFCTFLHFEGGVSGGALDGDFSDLLSKATLNGQPLDTENVSFICGLWIGWDNGIILRFKALPAENSVLVFPAGATFTVGGEDTNVYEISETVELKMKNGKWSVPLPTAEFIGVNLWNNNIVTLAGSRLTILDFGVTALGNAVSTDKNLIAMAGVSVNGVKLTEIDGASITYMHGDNHMGIDLPMSAIYPTQEYPVTIMNVEAGTVFENYELPAITLSLIGGTWVVGEFEGMPQEDDYVTISDITGEARVELGAEGQVSAVDGYEGDVSLKFVYSSDQAIVNYAPYGGLTIYLNSTNLWDGWRIFFVGNVVYVYDATMGGSGEEHALIGQAEFGITNNFETQIEITIKQVDGKYSIVIGGSCAKILEINDITPIGDCIGGGIMMYSSVRGCKLKDYKYGDVFDPVLTIHSKQEIVVNEGDAVPEIYATAVDGYTELTPTYVWDEGAVTDGKMNAGVWNCIVTATDANGNFTTAIVRVTVKGETKYIVTFDGANEREYVYGAKVEQPEPPTKKPTEKYTYTFDGWYNGDEKWDFDHDIITGDLALVAKFVKNEVYYKVAVTISGETQTIYVTYGAQVDLSVFDKEGFEKEVKQNGEVVTSLIVTEDTAIEITYAKPTKETSSGCFGSVMGLGGMSLLLTAIGGCMLMRKKEEADEK